MAGTITDPIANESFLTDEDTILNSAVTLATGTTWNVTSINGAPVDFGNPVALPSGALLTFNADGTFDYDPNGVWDWLDAGGIIQLSDAFSWTVSDGNGGTDTAMATIFVDGLNDVPIAADDAFATDEETALSGNLLADNGNGADADPDASNGIHITAIDGATASVGGTIQLASGALLTVQADGSFDYDPNGAFEALNRGETALDGFTYTLTDAQNASDTATVEIAIDGISHLPEPVFALDETFIFDGRHDDVVDVGHPDALNVEAGTFTLDFTADSLHGRQVLFAMDEPGSDDGVAAWLRGDTLFFGDPTGCGSDTLKVRNVDIMKGENYNLAVSFGEAGQQVWLNGNLVASDSGETGGLLDNFGDLQIGAIDRNGDGWARQAFDGSIGEFTFYDSQLSGDDIAALIGGATPLPEGESTLAFGRSGDGWNRDDDDSGHRGRKFAFDDDRPFDFSTLRAGDNDGDKGGKGSWHDRWAFHDDADDDDAYERDVAGLDEPAGAVLDWHDTTQHDNFLFG